MSISSSTSIMPLNRLNSPQKVSEVAVKVTDPEVLAKFSEAPKKLIC